MPLLEVRDLVKYYGKRAVVNGVSFDVDAGEVVGLLGPNGAGKTTSFRMTTGQIVPNAGNVTFTGVDVTSWPMYRRARLGMGYLTQEQSIFRKLTVEKNLLAILEALPRSRTLGRRLRKKERWDRTNAALERFNLNHVRYNTAARASGGEKRRLEIARCLVCEPLLILLDEPFAAVDPKTTEDIRKNIRELAQQGIGILLTDHNVREVLKITDRSYLIKDGKVVTHGTPQQLIRDPIAIDEYLGTTFTDNTFGGGMASSPAPPAPPAAPAAPAAEAPATVVLPGGMEVMLLQERLRALVEHLRLAGTRRAAMEEFHRAGLAAVPVLLDTLERREIDLRVAATELLKLVLGGAVPFDPYSFEDQRRRQLLALRDRFERRAG